MLAPAAVARSTASPADVQGAKTTATPAFGSLGRSAALKTHVEQLSARLGQFEAEAQRFRDVRAESEVRMQVGELSVADWNVKARECDEAIAKLTESQAQARASLAQAREILSMVSGATKRSSDGA